MEATQRHHILLVDDDISTIQVLWCLLSEEAQIRFAKTAEQALAMALESPPDLLLIDQGLPDASGLDVVRTFQQESALKPVPVILLTGESRPELESLALESGAVDFLHKPIVGEQLVARVRAHLRQVDRGPAAAAAQSDDGEPPGPRRVLIVDDDVVAIKMLRNLLEAAGVQFHFATRGDEVLAMAEQVRPDLILLDAQLPGLDGVEVCRGLKRHPRLRDVPVLFVTRMDDAHIEAQALDVGAADYILKSSAPAVLRARIRAHLQRDRGGPATRAAAGSAGPSPEEVLQVLAELDGQAVLLLDAAWRVRCCSPGAAELFGVAAADAVGRRLRELWWAVHRRPVDGSELEQVADRDDITMELEAQLRQGPTCTELELVRCDGHCLPVRLNARAAGGAAARFALLQWSQVQAVQPTPGWSLDELPPSRALTLTELVQAADDESRALAAAWATDASRAEPLTDRARELQALLSDLRLLVDAAFAEPGTAAVPVAFEAVLAQARQLAGPTTVRADDPERGPLPEVVADPHRLAVALARLLQLSSAPGVRAGLQETQRGVRLEITGVGHLPSVEVLREACRPLLPADPVRHRSAQALRFAVVHHLLEDLGADLTVQAQAAGRLAITVELPRWDDAAPPPPIFVPP